MPNRGSMCRPRPPNSSSGSSMTSACMAASLGVPARLPLDLLLTGPSRRMCGAWCPARHRRMPIEPLDASQQLVGEPGLGVAVRGEAVVRLKLAVPAAVEAPEPQLQGRMVVVADLLRLGLAVVRPEDRPAENPR